MKVLWSENSDQMDELNADREVTKTFNPDAQIFQPIDAARKSVSPFNRNTAGLPSSPDGSPFGGKYPITNLSLSLSFFPSPHHQSFYKVKFRYLWQRSCCRRWWSSRSTPKSTSTAATTTATTATCRGTCHSMEPSHWW